MHALLNSTCAAAANTLGTHLKRIGNAVRTAAGPALCTPTALAEARIAWQRKVLPLQASAARQGCASAVRDAQEMSELCPKPAGPPR